MDGNFRNPAGESPPRAEPTQAAVGVPASADRLVEAVYRKHGAYLYRHLVFILGDKDEAWDVLQQAFFVFLGYLRQDKRCERVQPFLRRTATRLAIAQARSWLWRRRPLDDLPEDALRGDDLPADMVDGVRRAYQRLAPKARAVLEAMLIEHMSYSEMKDSLGFSATTIKRSIRCIIKTLKKFGIDHEKIWPQKGGWMHL